MKPEASHADRNADPGVPRHLLFPAMSNCEQVNRGGNRGSVCVSDIVQVQYFDQMIWRCSKKKVQVGDARERFKETPNQRGNSPCTNKVNHPLLEHYPIQFRRYPGHQYSAKETNNQMREQRVSPF